MICNSIVVILWKKAFWLSLCVRDQNKPEQMFVFQTACIVSLNLHLVIAFNWLLW